MKIKLFLSSVFMLFVAGVFAQTVDTTGLSENNPFDPISSTSMIEAYQILYGALVIVWGYIAKIFGIKITNKHFVFTVLAGGLVLLGAFLIAGVGSTLPLLFSFLGAIGVYDLILKPVGATVKEKENE